MEKDVTIYMPCLFATFSVFFFFYIPLFSSLIFIDHNQMLKKIIHTGIGIICIWCDMMYID